MSLVFVDCEAWGKCPAMGQLTEFGAVVFENSKTFHGVLVPGRLEEENPKATFSDERAVAIMFEAWLKEFAKPPFVFCSDNNGFDWQWVNDLFWRTLGRNPFGHSSRRIGDFYAGLMGDFRQTQRWKKYRITKHTHHPVDDAMGNVEAFRRILEEAARGNR